MTFDQFKRAIIAKTKDKSNMPDWYYERLSKCIGCEHNSGNVDKISLVDRLRLAHNFGEDGCLICSCGVKSKSSDPQEECPIGKWKKQYEVLQSTLHTITNNSPEIAKLAKEGTYYSLDYGTMKQGANSEIKITVNMKNAINVSSAASCQCTATKVEKDGDNYRLNIKYNTNNLGEIKNKTVRINYTKDNVRTQISFLIKGTVLQ